MNKLLTLQSKQELIPKTFLLKFSSETEINFLPGQFVVLQVQPKVFRSYSIADLNLDNPKELTLLIDTRVGGIASKFFDRIKLGDQVEMINKPLGKLTIDLNSIEPKTDFVFIATGTGLAPFIPLIKHLKSNKPDSKIRLFLGAKTEEEIYLNKLLSSDLVDSIFCISRQTLLTLPNSTSGRVTNVLPKYFEELASSHIFICGNREMVTDVQNLLQNNNFTKIHCEKY